MELIDFRNLQINEIKARAIEEKIHPNDIYVREIKETIVNDFNFAPDLTECYIEQEKSSLNKKKYKIDAGFFEISSNTLHLLLVDFDEELNLKTINTEEYKKSADLMLSFIDNFVLNRESNMLKIEDSQPHVQLAVQIRQNLKDLYTIQLYYASTNLISKTIKNIQLDDFTKGEFKFRVKLEIIDIQKFYNSKSAEFKKEEIIIETKDYGLEGIQAIKAEVESDEYEAYLAVVPGEFLSEIYKNHGARLLEANVRSFLNTTGGVNKGIAKTLISDQSKFFAYNNGISTTAKTVDVKKTTEGLLLTKFSDFQIINGGQTTASLASFSIREKKPLSNAFVQMKLTILKKENSDLIRSISRYANSQNKVTSADLSSNSDYFVKIEELSRRLHTTLAGLPYQTRWFFERTRGQYKQSMMKLTNSEINKFERVNPKNQCFSKTDLAKFSNSYAIKPFDVAWGSEVNASRFVEEIDLMWDDNPAQFNELYFKKLIAKAIIFKSVEKTISNQEWYIQKKGYRAEMVGYVISKIVYDINKLGLEINLEEIWKNQRTSENFNSEVEIISFAVFNHFYNDKRSIANIREYAKKEVCWTDLKDAKENYTKDFLNELVKIKDASDNDKAAEKIEKENIELIAEIEVFNLGKDYWNSFLKKGNEKKSINEKDISILNDTIKYCSTGGGNYSELKAKYVIKLRKKLTDAGIVNG